MQRIQNTSAGHRLVIVYSMVALLLPLGNAAEPVSDRFSQPSKTVDQLLQGSWMTTGIRPSPRSGDAEFCRRVWLDFAGVAPPVWELRRFIADDADDKREQLIDQLLNSSRFATHMADRWNEFLLPQDVQEDQSNNAIALQQWLRKQFLNNTPYDHLVGAFLTAGGKSDQGPAIFYTSRNLEPVKLAGATSRLFLGIDLECAQCHNHPFANWTQDDFWSFAAFFSQLQLGNSPMGGGQAIEDRQGVELTFPDTDRLMPPRYPGVSEPPEPDPTDFRRRQLTIWLASKNNPYFARAAANRAWVHLFGIGLVDSVDQLSADAPTSHSELLRYLADYLVEQRFDLRALYAMLSRTDAYHRTSEISEGIRPPATSFAAMSIKTLSAAQYFDSLDQNVLLGQLAAADIASQPGTPRINNPIREQFLRRMKAADDSRINYPHGIVQALGMMNGPETLLASAENQSSLVATLEAPYLSDRERIDAIFLACLSRPATDKEQEQFLDYLNQKSTGQSRASRISDLIWILLNTAECFVCP